MTVEQFYAECVRRSIRLWVGGAGNLEVAAPKGELTPQVVDAIRAFKPALLAYLAALPPVDPVPDRADVQEPTRELDLFQDAELLEIAYCYDDRGWCESRVGTELVCLCVDDSSLGLSAPSSAQVADSGAFGDSRLTVYRIAEVNALKSLGITADGPALHGYHRDKKALIESLDIGVAGYLRSDKFRAQFGTWGSLLKRAEFLSPGITGRAETLLTVLIAGKQFVEVEKSIACGDKYSMIRLATAHDRRPLFVHGEKMNYGDDTSDGFDDPFAKVGHE